MSFRPLLFIAAAAIGLAPLACGPSSNGAGGDGGPGGQGGTAGQGGMAGQGGASDGGLPDGAGGDGAVNNCPAPTGAPIIHDSDITQDETWGADSVHVVTNSHVVTAGVTLTIAPCAVVQLDPDVELELDGTLDAEGTASQPIRFERHGKDAWANLYITHGAKATLAFATFDGGGSDTGTYSGATIVAYGDDMKPPMEPLLSVDHVTVENSMGYGMLVGQNASFASSSTALTLTGNGKADTAHPYPLFVQTRAIGTVPDGMYTGNQTDAIGIDSADGADELGDVTMKDLGVPWVSDDTIDVTPDATTPSASLHIDPGVTLELGKDANLVVSDQGGKLETAGTSQKVVKIQRSGADPWGEVLINGPATGSLSYTTLDGGGNDTVTYAGASLVAYGENQPPLQPILKVFHVTVQGSKGRGVMVDRYAAFTSDSTSLTVSGSGANSTTYTRPLMIGAHALTSVPDGTYTGNTVAQIYVDANSGAELDKDITVHDRGVPYYLDQGLTVDQGTQTTAPKLTLEAGTQMLFDPGANSPGNLFLDVYAGSLEVDGTAQKPVVLGSAAATPAPGDWVGVDFDAKAAAFTQKIDHASIEYAGAGSGAGSWTCDPTVGGTTLPENAGVLILGWAPSSEFVTNTHIKQSGGHGILRGWDLSQGPATSFLPTNTFDLAKNGYLDQTQPTNNNVTPSCP